MFAGLFFEALQIRKFGMNGTIGKTVKTMEIAKYEVLFEAYSLKIIARQKIYSDIKVIIETMAPNELATRRKMTAPMWLELV